MPPSERPALNTPPSRIRPLALWAALAVAIALALSIASAAAAPNPIARDLQQQTGEPDLPAPALTAQPAAGAVELRWTEIPGAARYELWLWKDEETDWQLVSDTITRAAFTHTETTPGATCYYAVRALDDAGEPVSAWSQNVPATIPAAAADQPQLPASTPTPTSTSTPAPLQTRVDSNTAAPQLTAQPAAGAVELRWTEIPGAARYELWLWKDEETDWQLVSDTITRAAFTHTETTPGATCYYAVRALDDAGEPVSAWSQNVPATIPAAAADQPQLPASTPTPTSTSTPAPLQTRVDSNTAAPQLTAQPAAGAVELRWTEIPGAARSELWTWWDRDTGWQFISDTITATNYTDDDVTPGVTYYYAVRALDAAGQALTGWSDYASAVPLPAFTPTPTPTPPSNPAPASSPTATLTPTSTQPPAATPTLTPTPTPTSTPAPSTLPAPDLTAQPAPGAVELRWPEIPGAARYELWTWWNQDTGWQFISDRITETAYTHSELTPGITYYYALRALDAAAAAGPWSGNVSAAPLPASAASPTLTPAPTLTPTPTPTPTAAPNRQLPPPPASLELDPYYRKYLDAGGIPVVASSDVADVHLYHARDIINAMLSHRTDLRATMAANRFRVVIYRHDGCRGPYQTPELRSELPPGRCTNTAGTATVRWLRNRYTGEVLLIVDAVGTAPAVRQPFCNVIFVHEFAHMVHYALAIETALSGSRPLFDSQFDARLKSAYSAAMHAGLYPDAYASTSYREYWAEAVMFWFLPDMLSGVVRTPASVTQLADYDPRAAAIVRDVFRAAALPQCEPLYLRLFGKLTGPGGQPLAGITVSADLRVLNASDRSGYSSVTHSLPTGADGAYLVTINRPRLASLRNQLRQETGASDPVTFFLLAVARRPASGCPAGYLAAASRQVENIAPHHAAEFPIPQTDPAPIPLQIAPTFTWTPRPAC